MTTVPRAEQLPKAGRHTVITQRAARLASKDRRDHPHATDEPCNLVKMHGPHPWGPIVEDSLTHWCEGNRPPVVLYDGLDRFRVPRSAR